MKRLLISIVIGLAIMVSFYIGANAAVQLAASLLPPQAAVDQAVPGGLGVGVNVQPAGGL